VISSVSVNVSKHFAILSTINMSISNHNTVIVTCSFNDHSLLSVIVYLLVFAISTLLSIVNVILKMQSLNSLVYTSLYDLDIVSPRLQMTWPVLIYFTFKQYVFAVNSR